MKKISIIVSLIVVLSMVLAACSSGEENNEKNGLGTPGAGQTAPGFETTPSAGGAITGTGAVTSTLPAIAPTTAPLTGTTGVTSTTTTTGTTGANILPVTGETGWAYLKSIMDAKVVNANGDELAGVNDAIINIKNTKIHYLVITTGGFLGIGKKAILVPWEAFAVQTKGENGAVNSSSAVTGTTGLTGTTGVTGTQGLTGVMGEKVLVLNVSENDLKNSPDFNKSSLDFNNPDWESNFRSYWNNIVTTPMTGTVGLGNSSAVTSSITSTTATTGTTGTQMNLTDWVYAKDLLGMKIQSSNGDDFGTIDNAVVNEKTGMIDYVVVSASDALGIGDKEILVPLKMFSRSTTDEKVLVFNGTMKT